MLLAFGKHIKVFSLKELDQAMQIPLVDLQAQYHQIKTEVLMAIENVLEGMQLFLGPEQEAFENEFAAYCGSQYGVGVSNGTDALALALRACNVGLGDEVITVAHTFIATVEAIVQVGATPVFVDVDPQTCTMDWHQLEQVLTERTRAIIPVHLYGHPAEMQPILAFAEAHKLWVIEDASQAHGATYQGKRVGGLGDIGCFSFYCSKNLGAYGEAGICVTQNAELAERLRLLRDHGSRIRYQHDMLGVNARMDEIQAAILRIKLKYLDQWNAARQAHAHTYTQQLQDVVVAVPVVRAESTHVYHLYTVQVQHRDQFRQKLQQAGIATGIHYPVPLHLQPACAHFGYKQGMFPVTEAIAEHIVSLPMYAELTDEQLHRVIQTIQRSREAIVS